MNGCFFGFEQPATRPAFSRKCAKERFGGGHCAHRATLSERMTEIWRGPYMVRMRDITSCVALGRRKSTQIATPSVHAILGRPSEIESPVAAVGLPE
jgi:hypothetical protein